MPTPFTIRPLERRDVETVATFEREIALASFPEDPVTDLSFYAKKLNNNLGQPGALVAELNGEVVGWAWVAPRENFTTQERYCDFRSLYVAPAGRSLGVAFVLMRAVLDFCRANRLAKIVGRTSARNETMRAVYRLYDFAEKHVVYEREVDLPPGGAVVTTGATAGGVKARPSAPVPKDAGRPSRHNRHNRRP